MTFVLKHISNELGITLLVRFGNLFQVSCNLSSWFVNCTLAINTKRGQLNKIR